LIAQLAAKALVKSFADLYRLDQSTLERPRAVWGRNRRRTCLKQSRASKNNDVWRLIYGLGIRHVGERGAEVLAGLFGSVEAIEEASVEALQEARTSALSSPYAIRQWFDEPRNRGAS
jgi:DNA ligase (NAD+)